jgi:hypothetical protein
MRERLRIFAGFQAGEPLVNFERERRHMIEALQANPLIAVTSTLFDDRIWEPVIRGFAQDSHELRKFFELS